MEKDTNNSNEHNTNSLYIDKFRYKIFLSFFIFRLPKPDFVDYLYEREKQHRLRGCERR